MELNLLYFACCIVFYFPLLVVLFAGGFKTTGFYLSMLPIILTGPFTAGFTRILRDYVREYPAFLFSDYKDAVKENWKQGLASMAVTVLGTALLIFAFDFYSKNAKSNSFFVVLEGLVFIVGILFAFMQYYLFPMLITFKMKLKDIYRNAVLFAFLGIGRNFLVTAVVAAVLVLTIAFRYLAVLFYLVLIPSAIGFLINFAAWPILKKYMIDPHPELMPKGREKDPENTFFDDSEKSPK